MDTVTPGEISNWNHPPFGEGSGVIKNKKMYGLGASDEKAAVASLMMLAKKISKKDLETDVWLTFVNKEESDGSGTKSFIDWFEKEGHLAKYNNLAAVLLEPTGLATLELGHRGNIFVKLTTNGDSGNGSKPKEIKTHSVLEMMKVLNVVEGLDDEWSKSYTHQILGAPSIGVATSIQAGNMETPNKFPSTCVATLDIRTTPELHGVVLEKLKDQLKGFPVQVDYLYDPAPFGLTEGDSLIVTTMQEILPYKVKLSISWGSTDQCFFTAKNIPAVVFGPGEKRTMHKPNEFCYINKIDKGVDIFQTLINMWSKQK
jgi:acetylornithine deacetylase/succinyl-diaminopimelate desuccinylase-like protein